MQKLSPLGPGSPASVAVTWKVTPPLLLVPKPVMVLVQPGAKLVIAMLFTLSPISWSS